MQGKIVTYEMANRCFENVAKFKYLGTTVIHHTLIHEEIKSRLNSSNSCYHSVQKHLYSRLLPRNVNIKIYKTVILPVVLYGFGTCSLALREEHRLKVFEKRVLRGIFGTKRDDTIGGWRTLDSDELRNLYSSPNIIRMIIQEEWDGQNISLHATNYIQ
jgi:hypothetical protein